MSEEKKKDSGSTPAGTAMTTSTGQRPNQEIDQAGAAQLVQKAAQTALLDNVDAIMKRVAEGAKNGDDAKVKMLFDWVFKLPAVGSGEIPQSFAAELWEISKQLLADAGE